MPMPSQVQTQPQPAASEGTDGLEVPDISRLNINPEEESKQPHDPNAFEESKETTAVQIVKA